MQCNYPVFASFFFLFFGGLENNNDKWLHEGSVCESFGETFILSEKDC